MKDSDENGILDYAYEVKKLLKKAGVRVDVDSRKNYTPGWKFNHWEQKGVPLRMEIGPRDVANKQCRVVRRDNNQKQDISIEGDGVFGTTIQELLTTIQGDMLTRAIAAREDKIVKVYAWKDFVPNIEQQCMVLTPFCDTEEWEEKVKKMSRDEALRGGFEEETCATSVAAKTLCKPFNQPELPEGTKCFVSGLPAKAWVLWGRSY